MEWLREIDTKLLLWINKDLSSGALDSFFPWFTDLHKNFFVYALILPLLIGAVIWFYRKRGAIVIAGLVMTVGFDDFICGKIIKPFFSRPRPNYTELNIIQRAPEYGGFSFPSNHSANMFCLATFLAFFFPRASVLFFIIAVLVAFSRVYVGVHYPLDVAGGALIGFAIGFIGATLTKKFLAKKGL